MVIQLGTIQHMMEYGEGLDEYNSATIIDSIDTLKSEVENQEHDYKCNLRRCQGKFGCVCPKKGVPIGFYGSNPSPYDYPFEKKFALPTPNKRAPTSPPPKSSASITAAGLRALSPASRAIDLEFDEASVRDSEPFRFVIADDDWSFSPPKYKKSNSDTRSTYSKLTRSNSLSPSRSRTKPKPEKEKEEKQIPAEIESPVQIAEAKFEESPIVEVVPEPEPEPFPVIDEPIIEEKKEFVIIHYEQLTKSFPIVNGSLESSKIDKLWDITTTYPNTKICLSAFSPSDFGYEDFGMNERPYIDERKKVFLGLKHENQYWVYIDEEEEVDEYEKRRLAFMRMESQKIFIAEEDDGVKLSGKYKTHK